MTNKSADNGTTPTSAQAQATPAAKTPVKATAERRTAERLDLEGIYLDVRASLLRYASKYFKRTQEAEDVVQEAFVKVIEAHRKRQIHSPKSYLFRTARNLSLAQISKSSYRLTDELGDLLTESELMASKTLEEQFEARENFEVFCRAVRTLPVKCRRAFVLCRVYGFSQKEAADRMGIGIKGIEAHLSRATLRCIEYIDAEQASKHQRANLKGRTGQQVSK
jgi:RNA polymerase sigma-70 factor (ECF subfamily)